MSVRFAQSGEKEQTNEGALIRRNNKKKRPKQVDGECESEGRPRIYREAQTQSGRYNEDVWLDNMDASTLTCVKEAPTHFVRSTKHDKG